MHIDITLPSSRKSESPGLDIGREMIQLNQNIVNLLPDKTHKVILFIGSQKGEGTSTIAREFARTCAIKLGKSVLLLDGDQQEPSQHVFFGLDPSHGWEDALTGSAPLEKVVHRVGETSLFVCPVSPRSPQITQDISTAVIGAFWETLRKAFDLVVIDAPPATSTSNGLALARGVDGVILVLEADKTRLPVAENVRENIGQGSGKIIGIVFNKRRYYIPGFIYRLL